MAHRTNMSRVAEDEKPTKEEYAVAKFLRFNVPIKEAKLHNMDVKCFVASNAVDALMESKWSASKNAKEPLFVNRHSCVDYCHRLLEKGLFHRAERVLSKKEKDRSERVKRKKKKAKDTTEKEDGGAGEELLTERKAGQGQDGDDQEKPVAVEGEQGKVEKTEENKDTKKGKKVKPLKLLMTDDQIFLDGEENIYVWIHDPASPKTILIGTLIEFLEKPVPEMLAMIGVAALCLLPLWPQCVRMGVYYVSLVAAAFVGFILSLVVVRLVVFCVVWVVTRGRHHLWVLPNLTEDVSLEESFLPLYTHSIVLPDPAQKTCTKPRSGKKPNRKGKKKKDKSSDVEESGSEPEFEMVHRGDVEEEEEEEKDDHVDDDDEEERMEESEDEEEDGEENEETRREEEEEEEECGVEEEEENDGLEEDYEEREDEDEDLELKKDK